MNDKLRFVTYSTLNELYLHLILEGITGVYRETQQGINKETLYRETEYYPKLLNLLKEYKEWIKTESPSSVNSEVANMLQTIDEFIKDMKGTKKGLLRINPQQRLLESMIIHYTHIFQNSTLISKRISNNLIIQTDTNKKQNRLQNPHQKDKKAQIYALYKEAIDNTEGYARLFLNASKASFSYGLNQMKEVAVCWIAIYELPERKTIKTIHTHLTSALFFLVSAHEKIIHAIAYDLGLTNKPDKVWYCKSQEFIRTQKKDLYSEITKSDRTKTIETARRLRNANTHRIANLTSDEVKGYLVSLIEEIELTLSLYLSHCKSSPR